MPLSTNATARAPAAMPEAPRVVEDSWQVTAATPTHTSPTAATEAPVSSAPSTGCPVTAIAAASTTARTTSAATATSDGGGQAGVPSDDGRAEHLGPPELLVLAGVPDHREGAHQGGSTASETYSRCSM